MTPKLFNTLALEINSYCNRSCKFCPVAYNYRPDEPMSRELFDKALDELSDLGYKGRIEFYIYNEPTSNLPYLLNCIIETRLAVPRATLMIATNGDYIRGVGDLVMLYNAGLNQLLINCYSKGLYEKRLAWVKELVANGVSTDKPIYHPVPVSTRVVQILDKSDPDNFGKGVFKIANRAGNIPEFLPATREPLAKMCVKPFRLLNINWQGQALVCCQDYHGDMSYGSLRESSLVELWHHPVMNLYRQRLLAKDRSLPLCRHCDCSSGAYPHMVSEPVGEIATEAEVRNLYEENQCERLMQEQISIDKLYKR